jgi:hypothetical protein
MFVSSTVHGTSVENFQPSILNININPLIFFASAIPYTPFSYLLELSSLLVLSSTQVPRVDSDRAAWWPEEVAWEGVYCVLLLMPYCRGRVRHQTLFNYYVNYFI